MSRAAIEAPAPAQVADGIWRPQFLEERQAYICARCVKLGQGTRHEVHGAHLDGPNGKRFSPFFIFQIGDAQDYCDGLNDMERANG